MKNFTAILLAACLFLPFAGTWGFLQYEKKRHRQEVINRILDGLGQDEVVTLVFSREETLTRLKWEHEREFELDGQMYDIVRSEEKGDMMVYHCVADHKESRLNREIHKVFSRSASQDPFSKNQSERLAQFLKSLIHPQALSRPAPIPSANRLQHPLFVNGYISLFLTPPAPPPRSV